MTDPKPHITTEEQYKQRQAEQKRRAKVISLTPFKQALLDSESK